MADTIVQMDIASYPLLRNDISYEMQSSYDRTGGNDDGFTGKYSVIRKEKNTVVISEIKGAGTITRIWFPSEPDYPEGPLALRDKRIYIYLDGNIKPAIDMPAINMFNGKDKHFPYPLCGMGLGGCWSYVPISFNKGAKVAVEGSGAKFFHVQYSKYTGKGKLQTYTRNDTIPIPGYDALQPAMWRTGDIGKLVSAGALFNTVKYSLHAGVNDLSFVRGPALLRGLIVKSSPANLEKLLEGTLSMTWDGANLPAVKVPLSMFFIHERNGLAARSMLAGTLQDGEGLYNFYPMPYRDSARVQITVPEGCDVEITTVFDRPAQLGDMAYLHVQHVKDFPNKPGSKHVFLDMDGQGHYAGTYLRVTGGSLLDSSKDRIVNWSGCLEGDETFEVDGNVVERGTGTEDYFDAGWNGLPLRLDRAGTYPFHGFTLFDAGPTHSSVAAYRWRMPFELVPFKKHFRADIEVGPADKDTGNYESISYIYLTRPGNTPTP